MSTLPFGDLRLVDLKGLKECQLVRLGHINVVCGRNNSGKSTLLEAITSPEKRFPGRLMDEAVAPEIYKALLRSAGWAKHDAQSSENRMLNKLVVSLLAEPALMFLNDASTFERLVDKQFRASVLQNWAFSTQGISEVFKQLMPNDAPSVLVSPKRSIETNQMVSANESVSRSGSGILNFLFYAKNQPTTSPEWKTYTRIVDAFGSISNGYAFDVFLGRNNSLDLRFAHNATSWITASDCGLGLQDLLVLLYFSTTPEFTVVAIEEPESHLHPDMQRRLLGFFKTCADRQFFISTHSNVFLNNVYVDRVFFTTFRDVVRVDDATSRASMLDDLGYSVADNLVTDVVVLVEGPTDTPIVEELLLKAGVLPQYDVKIWPLGGDIMDQVDLSVLLQTYKVIALLDRDPGSSKVRKRFRQRCADAGIPVTQLKRYAVENYFTLTALRSVFGVQIPAEVTSLVDSIPLETQIGINVKKNNRRLARALALPDIAGTDLGGFIEQVRALALESASQRGAA